MAGSKLVRTIALLIFFSHGVGVVANAYSFAVGDPRYAPALWLTFMMLKFTGVVAGFLLYKGLRLGAWLFGVGLIAGAAVALAFTGPHDIGLWMAAGAVLLLILIGFAALMRREWASLN
jgi:hypothetical protein